MWSIIIGIAATLVLGVAGVVASHGNRTLSIWLCFVAFILYALIAFKAWDDGGTADNVLLPGSQSTPKTLAPIPATALAVFLGNNCSFTTSFPHIIIEQGDEPIIWLERESGGLALSAKFFDKDGQIICEIVKNRFFLNPSNYFRIEKSRSRLTVFNKEARMTIDVMYLNPSAVQVLGDFYIRGGMRMTAVQKEVHLGGITLSGNLFGETRVMLHLPAAPQSNR